MMLIMMFKLGKLGIIGAFALAGGILLMTTMTPNVRDNVPDNVLLTSNCSPNCDSDSATATDTDVDTLIFGH